MSVLLYDEAFLGKLKRWVKDESMTITSPDETRRLFEQRSDLKDDKPIKLPLIALRRSPTIEISNVSKKPLTFDGLMTGANLEAQKSFELNAIPISLVYQIDIYTRYEAEALEYVRNFVFNIINYPKLQIEIPYNNSKILHNGNIRLNPEVLNNSSIPERLVPGQFSRYTLTVIVDDAYLWNYRPKDTKSLDVDNEVDVILKSDLDDNKNN